MNVLKALGVEEKLIKVGSICRTYRLCNQHGEVLPALVRPYTLLATAVEQAGSVVKYDHRLNDIVHTSDSVTATFENGISTTGSFLVGAGYSLPYTPGAVPPDYISNLPWIHGFWRTGYDVFSYRRAAGENISSRRCHDAHYWAGWTLGYLSGMIAESF
jgi:hypothetical protein